MNGYLKKKKQLTKHAFLEYRKGQREFSRTWKRLAIVTFTCTRDLPHLPQWAAAARYAFPGARLIAAFDNKESLPSGYSLPKGVTLVRTHFERNGNLNGIAAVHGILHSLSVIAEGLKAEFVMKVDTDTVLTSDAWLTLFEDEFDYIGMEGQTPLTATGIAYAMTKNFSQKLTRITKSWVWQKNSKFPEDSTIFSLAAIHGKVKLLPFLEDKWCTSFMPHHFSPENWPSLAVKAAIHCGQANTLLAYTRCPPSPCASTVATFAEQEPSPFAPSRADLVARQMKECLKALAYHPPISPPLFS